MENVYTQSVRSCLGETSMIGNEGINGKHIGNLLR